MSEIYTKTVVNHKIKGFFTCFKEIFCYVWIKIIQNTNVYSSAANTSIDLVWNAGYWFYKLQRVSYYWK